MDEKLGRQAIPVAEYRQTLHTLNQRYHEAWNRAERLQDELDNIKKSRAYCLLRWWQRLAKARTSVPKLSAPFAIEYLNDNAGPANGALSIVIPFRDRLDLLKTCLHGLRRSDYPARELVLVDNGSVCPRMLRYLERVGKLSGMRVFARLEPFNFAALCNFGARQASGDWLLFLNNDVEPMSSMWLQQLVRLGSCPNVGVVGAMLFYSDGTLQHAGIFPTPTGAWEHVHRGLAQERLGGCPELARAHTVPAVTGACLLIRRELFHALGGFDERFAVTYNDVDLCCRVRARGLKVAICPQARLWHHEALSRGYARDEVIP